VAFVQAELKPSSNMNESFLPTSVERCPSQRSEELFCLSAPEPEDSKKSFITREEEPDQ